MKVDSTSQLYQDIRLFCQMMIIPTGDCSVKHLTTERVEMKFLLECQQEKEYKILLKMHAYPAN